MRDIKFRGKRLDNSEWVYGCLTRYSEAMAYITVDLIENEVYKVDMETVGQCTGLRDKNGVKIFEGDIVRHKTSPYGVEVIFVNGAFRLGGASGHTLLNRIEGCEVIGNIFDNQSLLGGM